MAGQSPDSSAFLPKKRALKTLYKVSKRSSVDIDFQDLIYTAQDTTDYQKAFDEVDEVINGERLNNMRYADDNVVFADFFEGLQELMNRVTYASTEYGEALNIKKPSSWIVNLNMAGENSKKNMTLRKLQSFHRKTSYALEFSHLCYTIGNGEGRRQILKSINGKFSAGNLTAILGPSGAGKSTLLNILAGYVSSGVTGSIKVNDRPRQMKLFHKLSTYIMQEDLVQPLLTVKEAMTISANLKLGTHIKMEEKMEVIEEVLNVLGLENCVDTRTENLSGGQKKRLSLALELVNNPPVIFLDEPTTGLDNLATKQCIELCKTLTQQGRTVICTIHQPSASIFQLFDQVYFMSNGHCIYNGSVPQLVPFLSAAGVPCPENHSPADYIIELVHMNSDYTTILASNSENGKSNRKNEVNLKQLLVHTVGDESIQSIYADTTQPIEDYHSFGFATNFWTQFSILLRRMFLQMSRNKTMVWIQIIHHIISGGLLGSIFFGIGNNANLAISNFNFCLSVLVFFVYTHVMVPVLIFPMEVKLLKREYFNRWYGLKAYFAASTLSSLPLMLILGTVFLFITYFMSSQPLDVHRFLLFSCTSLLVAITSQSLGLAIGSIFSITNGSCVGPSVLAPFLALCIHGVGYGSKIAPYMEVIIHVSYLRFGLVGLINPIYSNREYLECEEDLYCHYKDTKLLLRDLGMEESNYTVQIVALIGFCLFYRAIAYLALRYRLTSEFSNKILNYATKILKH